MAFDKEMIQAFYTALPQKINNIRAKLQRPLTLSEKILYAHLFDANKNAMLGISTITRGEDYVNFAPDRVAMQDATAQMALLQLMTSGKKCVAVPSSVHCDHLIQASHSAAEDLKTANATNSEVYDFLKNVSNKYGIDFWQAGAGIIHQIVLENYAFPGGMMIGTDSHTPNAGGATMIAIGVGGADAVDVMAGMAWELKMPKIIGVHLTGKLSGWTAPKDVILKLAGILTVKGATNCVIEYFGEGVKTISATGRATICNMGAEVGATTSIFPFDKKTADYLRITYRTDIAAAAEKVAEHLQADKEILTQPELFYDKIFEINLSELEPYINGPFTPDAAHTISEFANVVKSKNYPQTMEVGLIGSCTNSSYEDLARAASVLQDAENKGIKIKSELIINTGSQRVFEAIRRDGILEIFERAGAKIMANACGPCIGQWQRTNKYSDRSNSIVTSFNRNFAKRADGNPNTHAFVASPEMVAALSIAGNLCFNPLTDFLSNEKGEKVKLSEPERDIVLTQFHSENEGFILPQGNENEIVINENSERLQLLKPFEKSSFNDLQNLRLLIKTAGKCTTDHISMAGAWLRFRGHLDNISNNMLIGATNAFNEKTNSVLNPLTNDYEPVPFLARNFKTQNIGSVIVAEENYGEGSSREHAAMEPRFLNVKVIIAKSFARIHETNLKKQGLLALTFVEKSDYSKIGERDQFSISGDFSPNKPLTVTLLHEDGTSEQIIVNHTFNDLQIQWWQAGSALNYLKINN